VENMLAFANSYKNDLMTVVLTNNYRSTQPILDISKALINRNEERLVKQLDGLSKELLSSNEKIRQLTHTPVIKEYETQRHEMIDITISVEKLLAAGTPPGRIGILYKENKYGEELAEYFKLRNIPVYSKRSRNILCIPLAQKIIMILKYLAAEHDTPYGGDEMLFELLHYDWFGIPPLEVAKLSIENSNQRSGEKSSLRRLLYEKSNAAPRDLFSTGPHEGLKKASALLEKWIADVPNITLQTLFENIIREGNIIGYIMNHPEKHWFMQVLSGLFDFIKDETRRNPFMTLKDLVGIIDLMEKEDLSLPLVQVSGTDKGVNLLTTHGSKGLEFEHVFLAGANTAFWEKKRKPGGGYSFPDTLFSSLPKHAEEEELRRLFYVALTRAEQYLTISYSKYRTDGKELEPSMFIAEIQDKYELPVQPVLLSPEVIAEFQSLHFGISHMPEIEKIESDYVDRLLDKFVMNVTALNNYLNCPLEFYFRNLIRIPSPKNEAAEFGSAVHYALEMLFKKMLAKKEKGLPAEFPTKEEFISDFQWHMNRHRESFTKEQF